MSGFREPEIFREQMVLWAQRLCGLRDMREDLDVLQEPEERSDGRPLCHRRHSRV
jgi:hypothetical protein